MWPFTLSGRLLIVALVGRYLTNKLIRRGPLPYHRSFSHRTMRYCALMRFYQPFPAAIPRYGAGCPRVTHPSATKCIGDSAEASSVIHSVRLACVKHAASVHPEPGSNSHVLILVLDKQLAAIYSLIYCTFYKFENFFFGIVLLFSCQCSVSLSGTASSLYNHTRFLSSLFLNFLFFLKKPGTAPDSGL